MYSSPLKVLLFFGQIRQGVDPGLAKISIGVTDPLFKELLLQTGWLQPQTECIAMIFKHVGSSVIFQFKVKYLTRV